MVARLLKFNNEVVYEHLLTPEVPFALDYLEVVFSLCDVMCRIYAKFLEEVKRKPHNSTPCRWRGRNDEKVSFDVWELVGRFCCACLHFLSFCFRCVVACLALKLKVAGNPSVVKPDDCFAADWHHFSLRDS